MSDVHPEPSAPPTKILHRHPLSLRLRSGTTRPTHVPPAPRAPRRRRHHLSPALLQSRPVSVASFLPAPGPAFPEAASILLKRKSEAATHLRFLLKSGVKPSHVVPHLPTLVPLPHGPPFPASRNPKFLPPGGSAGSSWLLSLHTLSGWLLPQLRCHLLREVLSQSAPHGALPPPEICTPSLG